MVTESVAPLALIRWHHRFDSRPKVIRNRTHSRHRSIVAGQRLPIRETRPSEVDLGSVVGVFAIVTYQAPSLGSRDTLIESDPRPTRSMPARNSSRGSW